MTDKLVLDTSVIINGKAVEIVSTDQFPSEIIVPVAALDELQAQASKNREPGFVGLNELKKLREICVSRGITLRFAGERPSLDDIRLARSGRLDAIIREVATREGATLLTSDYVQSLVTEAQGAKVRYMPQETKTTGLRFQEYFTRDTISVHLKDGAPPMAKRGEPGNFNLYRLRDEPCSYPEINETIKEITEAARVSHNAAFEINREGALVLQLSEFRIAVARPPFSDDLEVTIVRPIIKLRLEDYHLSHRLLNRLEEKAEGILIAGPPGSGKTTFAGSLAEHFMKRGKIVKTLESPRDLQVGPEITQYAPLEGDFEKTAEILLLVRPDYSVFDEIRKTKDFHVFADLRLAGVGMVGVVHASNPVDAIHRFIGRVELGMVPHIIDTVIFIIDGQIKKVYDVQVVVKVPTGMTEADLARPVVEVKEFESGALEHEIYTFGEENVIVPILSSDRGIAPIEKLAQERILQEVSRYDEHAEVKIVSANKVVVKVDNQAVPKLVGKGGENVKKLERELGVAISVESKVPSLGRETRFELKETGNSLDIFFSGKMAGRSINVFADGRFVLNAIVGKRGKIRVTKDSDAGRAILSALLVNRDIKVFS